MPQCTAKSKRSGERCKRSAVKGTTVCSMHGGKAALMNRGSGNVNFKHGRYSKYIADPELARRYNEAQNDPELLAMQDEIMLLNAMLADALSRIDAGAAEKLWEKVAEHIQTFEIAMRTKDGRKQQEAWVKLRDVAERGLRDAESRAEAREIIQERRRLVESEQKRLMAMKAMLTADQAMVLFSEIMRAIDETVKDPATRSELHIKLAAIAGSASGGEG